MQTATTILEQLGGNRFVAMTGANTFVGDEEARSLRFKISSRLAKNGANLVKVTLMPTDLYTVIFWKSYTFRGRPQLRLISEHAGVYFDQLRPLFTEQTGLDTSL